MHIVIMKDVLNEAVQQVNRAITSRATLPILGGIKIEVSYRGVTLTASDTEISIQRFIPLEKDNISIVQLKRQGSVVLPAKFFVEIIKKLPSNEIEIEVKEHFQAIIRSGSSEVQIAGLDAEEYPILPSIEEHNTISINSDVLKSMIRQTVFSISTNEATPVLTGILWSLAQDGTLKFVATDRHRLASREMIIEKTDDNEFYNIVISGKTLNELSKILPDQNSIVDIVVTENQVLFKHYDLLFYTRILDGAYPDTSKIIPQTYKTELVVQAKMFTEAIDRAYLLSREEKTNIVKLITKEDGTIEITSSLSELGKITEQLEVSRMEGEPLKISFNSKFMLDALKVIDSETIHIGFTGAMSPIIIKPNDGTKMLHLILPYRTIQ